MALIEPGTALGPNPGKLSDCYGPYPKIHQALIKGTHPTPGGEGNLDPVGVLSLAPRAQVYLIESGTKGATGETTAKLIRAALNRHNTGGRLVDAISMSFGTCEAALSVARRRDEESALRLAASLGVAVFVSGGDGGSASSFNARGRPMCTKHPVDVRTRSVPARTEAGSVVAGELPGGDLGRRNRARHRRRASTAAVRPAGRSPTSSCGTRSRARSTGAGRRRWRQPHLHGRRRTVGEADRPEGLAARRETGHHRDCQPPARSVRRRRHQLLLAADGRCIRRPRSGRARPPSSGDRLVQPHAVSRLRRSSGSLQGLQRHRPRHHRPASAGCCKARRGYDEASGLGSVDFDRLASALIAHPSLEVPWTTIDLATSVPAPGIDAAITVTTNNDLAGTPNVINVFAGGASVGHCPGSPCHLAYSATHLPVTVTISADVGPLGASPGSSRALASTSRKVHAQVHRPAVPPPARLPRYGDPGDLPGTLTAGMRSSPVS